MSRQARKPSSSRYFHSSPSWSEPNPCSGRITMVSVGSTPHPLSRRQLRPDSSARAWNSLTARAQDLAAREPGEPRVVPRVAAPESARLAGQAEEPLEPRALDPARGLALGAGQEVEGRADADHRAREALAVRGHPALLLRAAEPDEEDARAGLANRFED